MGGYTKDQAVKLLTQAEYELMNVRLRHAALGAIHNHLKTYLDCMELEYYGDRSNQEKLMCQELRSALKRVKEVLATYYDKEADLMGG
jgi:hypothetical protein